MPFAARRCSDPTPPLPPVPALDIRREEDPVVMAVLQDRPAAEIARRFAAAHRAYVAWRDGEPAAWGWVATRVAEIGELGTAFTVPHRERYLWNFVTRPAHRGLGIYPRLLDAVVRREAREAERCWIAYAPENHASGSGIRKAGFVDFAELSFDAAGRAALKNILPGGARAAARVLGLPEAQDPLAPCWRCVRAGRVTARRATVGHTTAGRGETACAPGRCRCDYQRPEIGCAV